MLGQIIASHFHSSEYEIVILSRKAKSQHGHVRSVSWDGKTLESWAKELEDSLAVINLTGRTVNCRHTDENKRQILNSRVDSTKIIGQAIAQCTNPPKVWLNASSAAIYGNTGTQIIDETSPIADDFSAGVCRQWEEALNNSDTPQTRKIALRIGLILGKDGGALEQLLNLARWGLGGTVANGKQYMSWMHEKDFSNLIQWLIENEQVEGAINCCAPNPLPNKEFMKALRKAIGQPIGFPAPAFAVKIGAYFMGTEAELALTGRRVVSKIMEEKGFNFEFPLLQDAFDELLKK